MEYAQVIQMFSYYTPHTDKRRKPQVGYASFNHAIPLVKKAEAPLLFTIHNETYCSLPVRQWGGSLWCAIRQWELADEPLKHGIGLQKLATKARFLNSFHALAFIQPPGSKAILANFSQQARHNFLQQYASSHIIIGSHVYKKSGEPVYKLTTVGDKAVYLSVTTSIMGGASNYFTADKLTEAEQALQQRYMKHIKPAGGWFSIDGHIDVHCPNAVGKYLHYKPAKPAAKEQKENK